MALAGNSSSVEIARMCRQGRLTYSPYNTDAERARSALPPEHYAACCVLKPLGTGFVWYWFSGCFC